MTVSTSISRVEYAGNGVTTAFSFPYYFLANADLKVYVDGTLKTLTTHYTVSGAGSPAGGTVTLLTAPLAGQAVVIFRDPALTQSTDYAPNDPFPAESHERALDRLTMIAQRNRDLLDRSLVLPDGVAGVSAELPSPEANKVISWNSTATALQNRDASDFATALTYADRRVDIFTGDGSTVDFVLSETPAVVANTDVDLGGIGQTPGVDYQLLADGVTIRFDAAPSNGVRICVKYGQAVAQSRDDAGTVYFSETGAGAVSLAVQERLRERPSVTGYGATGSGGDESAAAAAMIAEHNFLYVPPNFTLICKNLQLSNGTQIVCDGTMKLPAGCADDDRLVYADQKSDLDIQIREIDGNYSGQSGVLGTHLIYLTRCPNAKVDVSYAHDHYIASGATMPSNDGFRNTSSGAIWLYQCDQAEVNIGLLEHWGREGIYLEECEKSQLSVGHCQAHATRNTEYSGVQVSGEGNRLLRASVDFCGASGVGFDTINGIISNILSTRTRENMGVNFGHPGFPASGSVASNIVVDGAFVDGIKVSSSTVDLTVENFSVRNAGRYGISVSDSSVRGKFTNGVVAYSGQANLQALATEIQTANVRSSDLDSRSMRLTMTSGTFQDGETVTASGGKSAVVRRMIRDLANQEEILFLNSVVGTFAVSDVVTGGTSGAVGTASSVNTPAQRLESGGGLVVEDVRLFAGTQNQIRLPDGTAIMYCTTAVAATGGVLATVTASYSSNVLWASAPTITASITNQNSTGAYVVDQLRASSTTAQFTVNLNASVTQTYSINLIAVGRWK